LDGVNNRLSAGGAPLRVLNLAHRAGVDGKRAAAHRAAQRHNLSASTHYDRARKYQKYAQ
jgi:hypothetical protein